MRLHLGPWGAGAHSRMQIYIYILYIYIYISAVKRFKYLIAINRIYVIVKSKLIAINRKFVSILNVPSFINFFHHFIFYFNALINMEKWIGLLYANVLFY